MAQSSAPPSHAPAEDADLTRTYVLVLIVEALVIVGLYALGKYFG